MLRRKMFDILSEWRSDRNHKCLVIKGERQVGKTYIVRRFGETYEHFVEINFLKQPSLKSAFDGDLDPDRIISILKMNMGEDGFVPGSTLIFFDEIQECKNARTSLKFFTESGKYDVVCSGSSLGIDELSDGDGRGSAPVGYETTITMNGLDFEEFLWAMKVPEDAIVEVRRCIRTYSPIHPGYLSKFESCFRDYMIVGGMPEAVQDYVDTNDYMSARRKILEITESSRADINKYNTGLDRLKTAECYDSIPYQLDQTNKKFMYSRITGEGSRRSAEKYMGNLLWIKAAGYANFCYSLCGIGSPLARMCDRGSFRVYLSDTGTLSNLYGIASINAIMKSDHAFNMGAVAENAVADCLSKSGFALYYYNKNSGSDRMEVDFLVETESGIHAIEVKSGKVRTAKSISRLDGVSSKVMLREGDIHDEDNGISGYPLFAAAFYGDVIGSEMSRNRWVLVRPYYTFSDKFIGKKYTFSNFNGLIFTLFQIAQQR